MSWLRRTTKLSDARVVSITKTEYDFEVQFSQKFIMTWKPVSDEWLNAICQSTLLFGIFITK